MTRRGVQVGVRVAVRGTLLALAGATLWAGVTAAGAGLPDRSVPGTAAERPQPVAPTGVGDVTGLDPSVQRAVARAIEAAEADGVLLEVTSGYRSATHQQELYDAAVAKYGSVAEARRWVLPPTESEHVQGRAVDVGPPAAAAWLDEHGVAFGLCRRYDNEPWHFERLAGAVGSSCPAREPSAAG